MATMERPGSLTSLRVLTGLLPLLCGLIAVLIGNIPIAPLAGRVPSPLLALVPVYYWCLVRPDLMTPAAALAIGLAQDVLFGGQPGVWTLSFVLTYALVANQRDSFAGLSGLAAVVGFAACAAVACASAYVTVALLFGRLPLVSPILAELAMTVIFYVPTAFIVGMIHHRFIGASRSDL